MKAKLHALMKHIRDRCESIRRRWNGDSDTPSNTARHTEEPTAQPGTAEAEQVPARVGWGTWDERLDQFSTGTHHDYSTRGSMRSAAKKWVLHAWRTGLDPARGDWQAVGAMLVASNLATSSYSPYRTHIGWWFDWCRDHRAEWPEYRSSSEDDG